MVEGQAHLRLVPHINRHEIYAGEDFRVDDYKSGEEKQMQITARESAINLFDVDYKMFPKSHHITRAYGVFLSMGDCIFVPAFYFYQFAAEAEPRTQIGPYKPSAIMVNIHYKGNSDLLQAFYSAVETNVLD